MKQIFLFTLIFFAMNAKGQVATNATLSTLIKDYNAKIPALLKDTADKGKSIRALQAENAALKARMKTNVFDTAFALVTKVNDSTNRISGNAWRVTDLSSKVTALQNAGYITQAAITNFNATTVAPIAARLTAAEAAVKTIPKTAVSTSTTTTTTILQ